MNTQPDATFYPYSSDAVTTTAAAAVVVVGIITMLLIFSLRKIQMTNQI